MGPLKQSLVENISLQRCNCNILGLQTLWPYSLKKPDFFRFRVFFRASSLQNKVGDPPIFFTFLTPLTHHLSMVKFANVLTVQANEDTMLRTHCCRHKCFPVCPRAQHFLRTHEMFLILFRNILCHIIIIISYIFIYPRIFRIA